MAKATYGQVQKFLTQTIIKLLLIQSIFLWLGILIANKGHGTFVQFSIFYSWLVLPVSFLNYFKSSPDTIPSALIFYFFSIPIIFLILSIITFSFSWKGKIKKSGLIKLMLCYFIGSVLATISSIDEPWLFYPHASLSIYTWVKGVAISLLASALLWHTFFQVISYKSKLINTDE